MQHNAVQNKSYSDDYSIKVEYNAHGKYWYVWTKSINPIRGAELSDCLTAIAEQITEQANNVH